MILGEMQNFSKYTLKVRKDEEGEKRFYGKRLPFEEMLQKSIIEAFLALQRVYISEKCFFWSMTKITFH